MYKLRINKRN